MAESCNSETEEVAIARQWLSRHISAATNQHVTIAELMEVVFSVWSMLKLYSEGQNEKLVSWRNLRGGRVEYLHHDTASRRRRRKGNLKSETVKYGHEPKGLRPEKDSAGKDQEHRQKTDPSSHQRGRPTKTTVTAVSPRDLLND
jgi:hypothetical protein